ncbi:MAG: class I SAM-dependent methyltransferase [Acidobacteriia bacterium]|nr:class I SAM-dependent methyltransferase [Terriglobia bacterium]
MFLCHQDAPGVDFLPRDTFLAADRTYWSRRHGYFQQWLKGQDQKEGPRGDAEFFAVCARAATAIEGATLDVGGGDSYLKHWLPKDVHYVCLDPEEYPLRRSRWGSALESSPEIPPPLLLRGAGEYLPFREEAFRTVFCLATLNHASNPQRVLQEIDRVLQPGGDLVLTLEDVPSLLPFCYLAGRQVLKMSLASAFFKWWPGRSSRVPPGVQTDHVPIPPSQVGKWLGDCFQLRKTFFVASRGVVEMGQRWQKVKPLPEGQQVS